MITVSIHMLSGIFTMCCSAAAVLRGEETELAQAVMHCNCKF